MQRAVGLFPMAITTKNDIIMRKLLFTLFLLLAVALPQAANAQDIHGDVNGDREVNIADVNAVISIILK